MALIQISKGCREASPPSESRHLATPSNSMLFGMVYGRLWSCGIQSPVSFAVPCPGLEIFGSFMKLQKSTGLCFLQQHPSRNFTSFSSTAENWRTCRCKSWRSCSCKAGSINWNWRTSCDSIVCQAKRQRKIWTTSSFRCHYCAISHHHFNVTCCHGIWCFYGSVGDIWH